MNSVVFLGGGRITSALAAGLRLAADRREIVVYDRNEEKLRALRRESQVEVARDLKSAVERSGILVLAVRPGSVAELFEQMAACGARASGLCVSLAAGIPIKKLRAMSGPSARWVRAMPSPVCRMGRGLTAICFDRRVAKKDRERVREFFGRVGAVIEIRENVFDVFTAAYSSSHGYHALAALAGAARSAGLDRENSLLAAAHALADGILYWRESGLSLDELLREAATPGGIAATTMAAMDEAGYSTAVAKGLKAGIARARRNARS